MSDDFFQTGGTLSEDAPSYVERRADTELLDALSRDELCLVLAPRQTGKSSLMVHALARLRQRGVRPAWVDLQPLGSITDADRWFHDVVEQIERTLALDADCLDWWEKHGRIGPMQRFMRFLEDVVLAGAGKVVLFFDEIETLFKLPFSDDFFTTLRSFYNARATNPRLKDLSFVLLGMANASEFIQDRSRTPFNIGTPIVLADFDPAATEGFGKVLGEQDGPLIERIFHWTQGQPFLVQIVAKALHALPPGQRSVEAVDQIVKRRFFEGELDKDTHLKFIRDYLLEKQPRQRRMLKLYRRVLAGEAVAYDARSPEQNRLRLAGVVRVAGQNLAPRNPIYATVFGDAWAKANTPKNLERWIAVGTSTALGLLLLWMFLVQPLLFPRFPPLDEIVRYTADPAVEWSLPLQNTHVSRVSLRRGDGGTEETLFEAERWFHVLVPAQHEDLRHRLGNFPVGENHYVLRLTAGWPEQAQEIKLAVTYYPNWEVKQFPNQRLLELNPVLEVGDKKIVFRDASNGRELGQLDGFPGSITATALSADRKRLLVGTANGSVGLWELAVIEGGEVSGRKVETKRLQGFTGLKQAITALAFAPDGRMAVSGSRDRSLRLWHLETGANLHTFNGLGGEVLAATISSDGRSLFSAGADGKLRHWDMLTGQGHDVLAQQKPFTALNLARDGKSLSVGDADGRLRIVDVASGKVAVEWQGHEGAVAQLAWSDDGRRLLSGGQDGGLKWWGIDGKKLGEASAQQPIRQAGWLAQGNLAYSMDAGNGLAVWQTGDARAVPVYVGHQGYIASHSLAFSPDGKWIASGGQDKTAKVWDMETGQMLRSFQHDGEVWGIKFLPNNTRLLANDSASHSVRLWEIATGNLLHSFDGHTGEMEDVDVSSYSQLAASASWDDSVKVWDLAQSKERYTLKNAHPSDAKCVVFSPDGKTLASGGRDDKIKLWNAADGLPIRSINTGATVRSVAFSPDGLSLISANDDNTLKLWEVATGKALRSFTGHEGEVRDVAYSPDGKTIASASRDGTVKLWDAATGTLLRNYTGHKGDVLAVAFSPDGRWIASGGDDGVVRLWWAKVR